MADRIEIGWLFDFYGPLLTERQQKLLALYCNEDFSLSEIAAREGISRQGVYDAVHRAARQLEDYETQLGLLKRKGNSDAVAFARGGVRWPLKD